MLSLFNLCLDSKEKTRRIVSQLDRMNYDLHHLSSHTDDTIYILGNKNLKQQEQTKDVLNYTSGNFETFEEAINNLEHDMDKYSRPKSATARGATCSLFPSKRNT